MVRLVRTLLEVTPVVVILDFDWLEPLSVKTLTSVLPLSVRVTRFVQIPSEENQHNLSYYAINKYLFKQQKAGKCNFKMTEIPVSKTIQNIYKTGLKYIISYAIVYYCNTCT